MQQACAAGTNVGKRSVNQDSFVVYPEHGLWLVADGVGGLDSGEVASAIASCTLARMIADGHGVNQSIEAAHYEIIDYAKAEAGRVCMASTLVLLLSKGNVYNIFWAGDSRAYLFDNGNRVKRLTRDHTYEQSLVDAGKLTAAEAGRKPKTGITKALGVNQLEHVRADSVSGKWRRHQKILLCSDGLSGHVADDEIAALMSGPGTDQEHIDALIDLALLQGSTDNVTAILVSAPSVIADDDDDTEIPDKSVLEGIN